MTSQSDSPLAVAMMGSPPSSSHLPTLSKILRGYAQLQHRRDENLGRLFPGATRGMTRRRILVEQSTVSLYDY